jgi:hypothetical protein
LSTFFFADSDDKTFKDMRVFETGCQSHFHDHLFARRHTGIVASRSRKRDAVGLKVANQVSV